MQETIQPGAFIRRRFGPEVTLSYMPNGGNLGDNLIAAATIQEFERHKLDWRLARGGRENLRPSDVLVYGGGGSLVGLYEGGIASLKFLLTLGKPIIVLPQTIRDHEDFWTAAPHMTVFCRDRVSFEYMRRYEQLEVFLADDMATGLDLSQPPYSGIVKYRKSFTALKVGDHTLNAFRKDGEARAGAEDAPSIDLSELAQPTLRSTAEIQSLAVLFLMSVAAAAKVRTDRLHVAVAAGLQGIPTEFFDNNYGKNRDVFANTLERKFPSIKLQPRPIA